MRHFDTSASSRRTAGLPSGAPAASAFLAFLAAAALLAAACAPATAGPEPASLSAVMELSGLATCSGPGFPVSSELVSVGQAEWGWWPWGRRAAVEEVRTGPVEEEEEEYDDEDVPSYGEELGDRRLGAASTRVGIEFGGFMPFGEKDEAFSSGQMGGVFIGFGLSSLAPGLLVTNEVRLLEGTTSSEQSSGADVSSLVFAIKDDFLLHFFPEAKGFNVHIFIGISLGIEKTTAETGSGTDTETDLWFLADAGLGAWITLTGPLDLILRAELDFIPTSTNVPFFAVGLMGLQLRF